jgi:hypothetical protein
MEEGPVDVSTEVSGRIDTMEMKTDTALGTLVRPFNSVTTTLQVTGDTSTSNSAKPSVRSSLSDTTSNEEEETNLQPRETFTEGIDKTAKSEAGSLVTSMGPLDQDIELSASQNRKAVSIETVSCDHNRMMR